MQGAPSTLEGLRKPRAHEGVPVTAGETGELAWAFLKVVGAVPTLAAVLWGVSSIAVGEGGFDDLRARLQLVSINQTLGYNDPMRYLEIVGPWLALGLFTLVAYMMILNGLNSGEARLKKASGDAHRREKRRRLGIPED